MQKPVVDILSFVLPTQVAFEYAMRLSEPGCIYNPWERVFFLDIIRGILRDVDDGMVYSYIGIACWRHK